MHVHCNVTSLTSLQLDQPHVLFMEAEYENRTRTCGTSVTSADALIAVTVCTYTRAGTSHDHNVKPEAIRKELHHLAEKVR